jgi:hypothetical protein
MIKHQLHNHVFYSWFPELFFQNIRKTQMKKIFLFPIILFTIFGFSKCGTIPIADDICQITTEICYYAQEICDFYSKQKSIQPTESKVKFEIRNAVYNLRQLNESIKQVQKNYSPDTEQIYREELTKIRDDLKRIFDEHLKKVE